MKTTILETRQLAAGYASGSSAKAAEIVSGVSLSLRGGEMVSLIGANGSGKSTLLRTVAGVQHPLRGETLILGKPTTAYNRLQMSRLVSIVTTDHTNAGGLTVAELVALGRQPHTGFLGRLSETDRKAVAAAMELVGIAHKAGSFTSELSDGERQKSMIARAIAQETPIILLDEPTSFLDAASRIDVLRLLHRLAAEQGKAVLLSSHDVSLSLALSDRLWLLRPDRTIVEGATEDLVLRGEMDGIFCDRDGVSFDAASGEFAPVAAGSAEIDLSCSTPLLTHWIGNALRRNGYAISPGARRKVTATSATSITISPSGQTVESVAELIDALAR